MKNESSFALLSYSRRNIRLLCGSLVSPLVFIIVDVSTAIASAYLLHSFNLQVDIRQHALIASTTVMQVTGVTTDATVEIPSPLIERPTVNLLLKQVLTQSTAKPQSTTHNTVHFIETTGPPIKASASRLSPDVLKAAKFEFWHNYNGPGYNPAVIWSLVLIMESDVLRGLPIRQFKDSI